MLTSKERSRAWAMTHRDYRTGQMTDPTPRVRSYSKVAVSFGVSKSLVAQIVRGELWA